MGAGRGEKRAVTLLAYLH